MGILKANTRPPTADSPTLPQNRGPTPNCACARDPFIPPSEPASYWFVVVPAEVIGPTCFPARPGLVRRERDKGHFSALNLGWLLGALGTESAW